jgi:dephospho-CoA kinase
MLIGLTGGVGSGKDLVSEGFKSLGASIIDADIIARDILKPGAPTYLEVIKEFGSEILQADKSIDRKKLGAIVFSNPERLKKLNAITHPVIMREVEARVAELKERLGLANDAIIIINAPLLIEVGHTELVEKLIVVYCDEDKQIERIIKRDSLTKDEALQRIRSQMPLTEKIKISDIAINNNHTREETLKQVREVYELLQGA